MARENLKGKNNLVSDIINKTSQLEKNKKFQKSLVFDYDMKDILERESKKRGTTTAGFIKYCIMKKLNEK